MATTASAGRKVAPGAACPRADGANVTYEWDLADGRILEFVRRSPRHYD